jgi:hypothetical protein
MVTLVLLIVFRPPVFFAYAKSTVLSSTPTAELKSWSISLTGPQSS